MLVLSRKVNEIICIGDDIRVVVAGIRDDKVRLAIDAPKSIPVHRNEVYDKIRSLQNGKEEKEGSGKVN